jgi:hypothetical protein
VAGRKSGVTESVTETNMVGCQLLPLGQWLHTSTAAWRCTAGVLPLRDHRPPPAVLLLLGADTWTQSATLGIRLTSKHPEPWRPEPHSLTPPGSRVALRVRLGEALASESPAVRAAAVEALGRAVASPVVLAAIAASSTPGNVRPGLLLVPLVLATVAC